MGLFPPIVIALLVISPNALASALGSDTQTLRIRIATQVESFQTLPHFAQWKCRGGRVAKLPHVYAKNQSVDLPAGTLFNGRSYQGSLTAEPGRQGCDIINHVALDDYLTSLVNSEMNSAWPAAALEAQVIAARTYALYQVKKSRRLGRHFDLEATVKDQMYEGKAKETAEGRLAVKRTQGVILADSKLSLFKNEPAPIQSYYHSTCGGGTESSKNAFGTSQAGSRVGVSCPFCNLSPKASWKREFAADELLKAFGVRGQYSIVGVDPVRRSASGRVETLELRAAQRPGDPTGLRSYTLSGAKFRERMGYDRILSTRFDVRVDSSLRRIEFIGKGYGHGVGMCQFGAKEMAQKGYGTQEILSRYYPDTRMVRVR